MIRKILGAGGALAGVIPGFQVRTGQIDLASAIRDAIVGGRHLLGEAPTGTGKSYAYLVPAIEHIRASYGNKVIVCTANIALQEQLCVAPSEKILTADLRHVPASEIEVGMRLIGFDEHRVNNRRRIRTAMVLSVQRFTKPCYRLWFEDGSTVVCSQDHTWLCTRKSGGAQWLTVKQMAPLAGKRRGSSIIRLVPMWTVDRSYTAGFLAASVDGEGWLSQKKSNQYNGVTTKLGFSQNLNPMLDAVRSMLAQKGFRFHEKRHGRDYCKRLEIYDRQDVLTFLGRFRPPRLLGKFDPDLLGTLPIKHRVMLIRKEDIGEQEVVAIGTSTQTLIVNGMTSHNCQKDIPTLHGLGDDIGHFTYAIAKGVSNFLCLHKAGTDGKARFEGKPTAAAVTDIETWAASTETGDVSEMSFVPEPAAWSGFSTTSEDCLGKKKCPQAEGCFMLANRARVASADLVVTNYHMLMADLAIAAQSGRRVLLPEANVVICDEGNRIPNIARDFFATVVSRWRVTRIANRVGVFDPKMQGWLFAEIGHLWEKIGAYGPGRLKPSQIVDTASLRACLESVAMAFTQEAATNEMYQGWAKQVRTVMSDLEVFDDRTSSERVYFIEQRGKRASTVLNSKPIHIGPILDEYLFGAFSSVICVSATMTAAGSFKFVAGELGAPPDKTDEITVASPFDLNKQALLVSPAMPGVNEGDFGPAMAKVLAEIIELAGGRTLALFTSWRNLRLATEALAGSKLTILSQGDAPRMNLIAQFKEDETSVLLGTESFWSGIDVPGPACSCVVIDRLPFSRPDDPVQQAMQERDRNGFFMNYSVPAAVIAFKQGVGRLIRCFDLETEILTTEGWKKYHQVKTGMQAYGIAPKHLDGGHNFLQHGASRLTPNPIRQIQFNNTPEPMLCIKGKSIDVKVTPDHGMMIRQPVSHLHSATTKRGDKEWTYKTPYSWVSPPTRKVVASELPFRFEIPLAGFLVRRPSKVHKDWFLLMGLIISDGSISKGRPTIQIHQSTSKPGIVALIDRLTARLNFSMNRYITQKAGTVMSVGGGPEYVRNGDMMLWQINGHDAARIRDIFHCGQRRRYSERTKYGQRTHKSWTAPGEFIVVDGWKEVIRDRIPRWVFERASRPQMLALLHGLMAGDGTWPDGKGSAEHRHGTYYTSSPSLADDVQELLALVGFRNKITVRRQGSHEIHFLKNGSVSLNRHTSVSAGEPASSWCVTTDLGNVLMRRGGSTFIAGNTSNDRGVIVCLDNRLTKKGYGKIFVKSLGGIPFAEDLKDAGKFFKAMYEETRLL